MEYLLHIFILIAIYAILATSLDLVVGETGLLSVTHAAFFGAGAYASAILSLQFDVPFIYGLLAGMMVATLMSFVVSLSSARVGEDYFAIVTFGLQIIASALFNNWISLTRGPLGIYGIAEPSIFGWNVRSQFEYFLLAGTFFAITILIVTRITSSPFGRVLRAIREEEIFAQAYGKNTLNFKIGAFGMSAALAASAGTLYAHYIAFIDPTSFTVMDSILVLSMVIIGGAGTRWGPLLGAIIIIALPESLRFLGLPSSVAANLRAISYGLLLVLVMKIRPVGLIGRYRFGR